jgi:16S rRNA (guanine527-N7)-methyltransferase
MSLPDMQFVGIDSVAKKLQAIQDMCSELSIQNVTLLWDRIEYMKKTFDIVTARAVAHIEKLLPRVHNLLRPGSLLILYKEAKSDEYQIMLRLLPQFDLKLIKEHRYSLFE